MAIMSSYNLINGLHTANAYDLLTEVLRNEWHFQGLVMTDWVTTSDVGGSVAWKCIKAGNDLIMPGLPSDQESIEAALSDGRLTEEDIRTCAARVVSIVLRSNGYEGSRSYYTRFL
jgi:beta-glucosidase